MSVSKDSLLTIFRLSSADYWIDLSGGGVAVKSELNFVFDLMRVPGFDDVFGLLFQNEKMTIFRDVLIENGVMWHELKDLESEYKQSQKRRLGITGYCQLANLKIALFGYRLRKRETVALIRYLKSKGAVVSIFLESMKLSDYLALSRDVEVYCLEVVL